MAQQATLWELIEWRAARSPDALLAVDERGRELSVGDFKRRAEAVAAGFAALGVGVGTNVSWQLPTWLETLVLTGALSRLGAIQNPIIPGYGARELRFVLEQTAAAVVVVPSSWRQVDYASLAAEITDRSVTRVVVVDPDSRILPSGDPATLPAAEAGGDPASAPVRWRYYTSGTTSVPKGVMHSDASALAAVPGMLRMLRPGPGDRASVVFPYAHIGGLVWLGTALTAGCCQILTEQFKPETTIPMLASAGVTLAGTGTPFNLAYLQAQRQLAGQEPEARLFPHVRAFMSGASPKPAGLHDEIRRAFGGAGIMSSYGLTECPILSVTTPTDPDDKLSRTEGRAAPGVEIRIVGADGAPAGAGREGEIRVKGPMLFKGYVDAALDAEALDAEGFLRTGDLGTLDGEGYLTITGRLKDVIIRKGENISAKEVEDLLYRHPDVADVAVIGVPDPASGERACAVVVPRPGAEPLSLAAMTGFLREQGLRTYALPEQIEVVDELPRNAAGKVQKAVLKARYDPEVDKEQP